MINKKILAGLFSILIASSISTETGAVTNSISSYVSGDASTVSVKVPTTLSAIFNPDKTNDLPSLPIVNSSPNAELKLSTMKVNGAYSVANKANIFCMVEELVDDYVGIDKKNFSLRFKLDSENTFKDFDSYGVYSGENLVGTYGFDGGVVIAPSEQVAIDFEITRNNFTKASSSVELLDISLDFDIVY